MQVPDVAAIEALAQGSWPASGADGGRSVVGGFPSMLLGPVMEHLRDVGGWAHRGFRGVMAWSVLGGGSISCAG